MKFLIGAIAEGLAFDGATIYEKSLGGSESAFAFMMRELAALGHQVHAFTKCPQPGIYDGVVYSDVSEFAKHAPIYEWDVLFVYRHYGWLTHPSHARLRVLVNHDILVPEGKSLLMSNLWQTDALFNLSQYHKQQYCEVAPELEPHIFVTKNGIDLPAIDAAIKGTEKNLKHFVYASRPERGLDVLLTSVWPRLREKDTERKLFIAGYTLDAGLQLPEHMLAFYDKIKRLVEETPGVVKAGSLPKPEWYKLLSECALYLYPSGFKEIFFINGAEAQACGTPVIATNDFALPETVAVRGCLIPGDHTTKEYQDAFVEKVETLLSDEVLYQNVQRSGRYHVEKSYPWPVVAEEWDKKLHQLFEERFQKNKYWVFRQLIYNSDILLARELARQEDMPVEQAEAEAIIRRAHSYCDEYAGDDPEVLLRFSQDFTNLGRVPVIAPYVDGAATLLEIGCHFAEHSIGLSNLYPGLRAIATDFSPQCIAQARRFQETIAKHPENIFLRVRDWSMALDPVEPRVDIVFAGEILEHVEDPYALIDCLETYVKPGGRVIITVPSGPWEAQSLQRRCHFSESDPRYHISDFRFRDLQEVFSKKKDFAFFYCPNGITERGELVGNWVIVYTAAASPTGRIDPRRKFLTTRPYQGISTCMIVGNEESNIRRCLESANGISDEIIVVGTPACADRTLEIAEEMGAYILRTTADSPDTPPEIIARCGPGDFGQWRNESIKNAQYPWIFWIDADEVLTGSSGMHKYLHSQLFNGFVVRQHHLCLDTKVVPDVPIRLFKNFKGYAFYGCVSGDTLIDCPRDMKRYPDGIPIRELEGKSGFWTYVYSRKRERFSLRKVKWVRKTRLQAPVMRMVWYDGYRDKYGELIATGDHPVLLRNGKYVRMDRLKPGMSLRVLRRNLKRKKKEQPYFRLRLGDGRRILEHCLVYSKTKGKIPSGFHVHHLNENTLDNTPGNLGLIEPGEHTIFHHSGKTKSAEARKLMSQNRPRFFGKANHRWGVPASEKARRAVGKSNHRRWKNIPAEIRREAMDLCAKGKAYKHIIAPYQDFNHSVVSIELWGYQDVYNMEVEGIHNFVANEIVIHNCIHEHCMRTLNEPIDPAYQLEDVNIAHFGYITEADRRRKCYGRNIALLMKDRLLNPDRILGWILLQRDYHNFISQRLEETRGLMDDQIINWLQSICGIFREHFAGDPESVYYKLSYNLYQQALCLLGQFGVAVSGCKTPPVEVGLWLGGSVGGLSDQMGQAAIPRMWFADRKEYLTHVDKMRDKLADILSV